jgi:hypothetical protein
MMNQPAFCEAFNVTPGDKMSLAAKDRGIAGKDWPTRRVVEKGLRVWPFFHARRSMATQQT